MFYKPVLQASKLVEFRGGKRLVETCPSLDVNYLNRERLLRPGLSYTMSWKQNGEEIASLRISTLDFEGDWIEITYDY